MQPSKLTFVAITIGMGIVCARGRPVPGLSIKGLVEPADLIIAGKVERVQQTGAGSIELSGVDYTRLDFQADMTVDEMIKGGPAPVSFTFGYSTPAMDSVGNVAEGGLAPNAYRVVFLKKTATGYAFVSPYYSSIPAASKSCGPNWQVQLGEGAYHKVLQRLLELLCMDSASSEEKQSALFVLNWREDSSAAPFLKAALNLPNIKSDPTLRMSIVSDLLCWKDLSVLPLAEQDLFDRSVRSFYPKSNLVLAISSLEPQISIPLLARALKLPQPEERVAAARFLEYTNSQTALDILLSALDDPDREVQFAVMQSLGNLTKQHQWRPTTIDSDSHWNACIQHWRELEVRRKTGTQ